MDYKKYYLKNFLSDDDKSKKKFNSPHYYQSQEKNNFSPQVIQPRIIYLQPQAPLPPEPKQEYEFEAVPVSQLRFGQRQLPQPAQSQQESQVHTSAPSIPHQQGKTKKRIKMTFKRAIIFIFVVIIGILSSFIASDIVTEGMVFKKMSAISKSKADKNDFFVVVLEEFGTYEDAQNFSVSLRSQGAGGFIIKDKEKFCVVGDVFDNEVDAKKVAEKQEKSRIVPLQIPTINYKTLPKPYDKKMSAYMDYMQVVVEKLNEVVLPLSSLEISEKEATQQIYAEYLSLQSKLEKFKQFCKNSKENFVFDIQCDMEVNLALLDNLCNQNLTRPNLACDIRYYKMQILVNFQHLCSEINKIVPVAKK